MGLDFVENFRHTPRPPATRDWRNAAGAPYRRHDEDPDAPLRPIDNRAQRSRRLVDQSTKRPDVCARRYGLSLIHATRIVPKDFGLTRRRAQEPSAEQAGGSDGPLR